VIGQLKVQRTAAASASAAAYFRPAVEETTELWVRRTAAAAAREVRLSQLLFPSTLHYS